MTLAVFTFGMVAQLIYDTIETIEFEPIEANEPVGEIVYKSQYGLFGLIL